MYSVQLRTIAEKHLLPLFSGAELRPELPSSSGDHCVALDDPCTILFKIEPGDKYRLVLWRSQPFDQVGSGKVTEMKVVEAFIKAVAKIQSGLRETYRDSLLSTITLEIVANAIAPQQLRRTFRSALEQLTFWATRLYEGRPITGALGFENNSKQKSDVTLSEISQSDFAAVLSNGFDTLLTLNNRGHLINHEQVKHLDTQHGYTPYRQGPIAEWAKGARIAISLNRLGEILVFKHQQLLFARRSGKWHFLTHEPVLTQMRHPNDKEIRRAVYESCLDASFARTGACIGIVTSSHYSQWKKLVTSEDDHLDKKKSLKAKSIAQILRGEPFQKLDRRLRQELLAIDGATLLDHRGNILAVGAILKIPGGSVSGGRLAAAKALSEYGIGIKVSQDGGIRGFRRGENEPIFSIM